MRYIVAFLIGIGLIVLLFVWIFHGGSSNRQGTKPQLPSYANTSTVVQYLDDYPTNAQQLHRQTVITVGQDQITFSVLSGYENQVLRTQTYNNNSAGYGAFLAGLQVEGFTDTINNSKLQDERGYCPQGHRYIFTLFNGSNTIERTWSTSCGNIGTFKGRTSTIRDLFTKQVPDYDTLIQNIGLY